MNQQLSVRELLLKWAEDTQAARNDSILANHQSDAVIYDVLPPLEYRGTQAYQASWDDWQPDTTEGSVFTWESLEVTAGEDLAFAHGIIRCEGNLADGGSYLDTVRATFCLRQTSEGWKIQHQHISMPRS